ncbi:hypothetical protein JTB14_007126 [Gonioctena quinquepunctata]|nr:hypothetical protein JTB14_007126 [Gonioctena quinquepunctata]
MDVEREETEQVDNDSREHRTTIYLFHGEILESPHQVFYDISSSWNSTILNCFIITTNLFHYFSHLTSFVVHKYSYLDKAAIDANMSKTATSLSMINSTCQI